MAQLMFRLELELNSFPKTQTVAIYQNLLVYKCNGNVAACRCKKWEHE